MDEPFDPPGARWIPVAPQLRSVWLFWLFAMCGFLALVGVGLGFATNWVIGGLVLAGAVVLALAGTVAVGRRVRAWGYDIGADALTIRSGVLFRSLVVVPYARMQYVDVEAGPVDRQFGIAAVQLHTASASTDARIPGLLAADAAALRDQLARLGETRSVGL